MEGISISLDCVRQAKTCRVVLFAWTSALLVFLLIAFGASAATVQTNLTYSNLPHQAVSPRISGNRVVYQSNKNDFDNNICQIYLYNSQTKAMIQITNDEYGSIGPDIDGSRIIYFRRNEDATFSLMLYTIGSDATELISGLASDRRSGDDSCIAGDIVVYRDFNQDIGLWELFYIDLSEESLTPHRITPSPPDLNNGDYHSPAISGSHIVYGIVSKNGKSADDVYMYDLDLAQEIPITDSVVGTDAWSAVISGDSIVYQTTENGLSETALYDISTHVKRTIEPGLPTVGSYGADPAGGPRVVYAKEDPLTNYYQYLAYNLLTGSIMTVSDNLPDVKDAALSGNKVVWAQQLGNNSDYYDIILGDLASDLPPVFGNLPGTTSPINVTDGQTISVSPYTVNVYPTDEFGIAKVEFYIDGVLRGTTTVPDITGAYSFSWDTYSYHSNLRVVAYNTGGLTAELTRNAVVTLPYTGK